MGIRRTFQNLELFREASVRENVALGLVYRYRSNTLSEFLCLPAPRAMRRAADAEANEIIESCALGEVADVRVSELPYGLQKSVELARALAALNASAPQPSRRSVANFMARHTTCECPQALDARDRTGK